MPPLRRRAGPLSPVTILDGGMGRQLQRSGAPFRQPEWSALALMETPDLVRAAHAAFIEAGAEVITTNSYALVPFHIGEARFAAEGERLAALSGRLARDAADAAAHPVRVAGSLPPPFGSYRPALFDPDRAPALLAPLVRGLAPSVDLFLAETQSSIAEAQAACRAARHTGKPVWVSFTLAEADEPRLRSGEAVADAVDAAERDGAAAVLFNCSPPEVMAAAVDVAQSVLRGRVPLGVYANLFPADDGDNDANAGISPVRADVTPARYAGFAQEWQRRGARIIGGCCGVGPEHICALGPTLD